MADQQKNSSQILEELLEKIDKVNFREYIRTSAKLQKKHLLVSVIEILLEKTSKDKFNLCRKNNQVYLFNGQYWEQIKESEFKDFLERVALKADVDKYDAKYHSFKDELLKQFLSSARLTEIPSDGNTTLINLKNGTFEINATNQVLREFNQLDFLTYQLPFEFDVEAKSPLFDKFLNEVLPDKELQDVLSEYLGYIFIKNSVLKLEKVLLLYGSGSNGKSVLFEIICALLGSQNISNFSLQSLTTKDGSRAMIADKLLNYASEINGKLEGSMFKQLASGEPVEARLLYSNSITVKDYARLLFNCNELPKEVENTHAYFRRFIIIPFTKTILPEDQDKDLSKKIITSELSGVFNFVITGLRRLLKNKSFTKSEIIAKKIKEYETESDSVLMFFEDENYEESSRETIRFIDLYSDYKSYCFNNNYKACSTKTFSQRLDKKNFEKKRLGHGIVVYIRKKV